MIPLLARVSWRNLSRDRAAQVMAFVLPVVFFSIFALVFGGASRGAGTRRVPALVVDESRTEASARLVRGLAAQQGLRVITAWAADGAPRGAAPVPLTRARAEELVRAGEAAVAYVLPAGIDTSLGRFDGGGTKVLLLTDPSDPVAPKMAAGLLQAATLAAGQEAAAAIGVKARPVEDLMPARVEERAVLGRRRDDDLVAFYAAGIAVMFLMFTASAGGGALLDESDAGTLERLLGTRLTMGRLLAAKWIYLATLGLAQVAVMFTWAAVVFHLPLLAHLPGFAVMAVATAACTSAFGLVLATLARTRAQLQGLANVVVLSFSAIGGSMFPRSLMGPGLQKASLVCFNRYAVDGWTAVFWREAPVASLWPQLAVLAAWTIVFLALARRLARRWETA